MVCPRDMCGTNVPDLQGQFLRGVSANTNQDPDRDSRTVFAGRSRYEPGSKQGDMLRRHEHRILGYAIESGAGRDPGIIIDDDRRSNREFSGYTEYSDGSETRPKNVYVNFIIKY
jgi:hypothetical protein